MSFFRLSNPSPKAELKHGGYNHAKGGDHARYVTRESATGGEREAIYTHNLPDYAREGETYRELRDNVTSWAQQRCEDELREGGRTHYRMTASFESKVETEKAREMAGEFMRENFPEGRGFAVVHQNTDQTHVHLYVDARREDGKKVDLSREQFKGRDKNLNERWNRLHEREVNRELSQTHRAKMAETREYKQACVRGEERAKPQRVNRYPKRTDYAEKEKREYGHESRAVRDERSTAGGEPAATAGERALSRGGQQLERSKQQAERTEQSARGALREAERVRERAHQRELSEREGRSR